jgi:hypothetical protein
VLAEQGLCEDEVGEEQSEHLPQGGHLEEKRNNQCKSGETAVLWPIECRFYPYGRPALGHVEAKQVSSTTSKQCLSGFCVQTLVKLEQMGPCCKVNASFSDE